MKRKVLYYHEKTTDFMGKSSCTSLLSVQNEMMQITTDHDLSCKHYMKLIGTMWSCQDEDISQLLVHYDDIWPASTLQIETSPDPLPLKSIVILYII